MSQPLDLDLLLTPPPEEALPEVIAHMTITCKALDLSHAGDLLADPLTAREQEDLRWYLEEYWKWPYEGFLERGKQVERLLPIIGKRLYQAAFGSPAARHIMQAWKQDPAKERQISVISDLPKVLSLPWELLHTHTGFLALSTRQTVSIVRRLPEDTSKPYIVPFAPPLRVLLVTARPKSEDFVDPRSIARELVNELQEQVAAGTIVLEFLRPATFEKLCSRLRDEKHPVHVLHFDGHGSFDKGNNGQGTLAFEDESGYLHKVYGRELATLFKESRVRLVMLTACQSAMGADDDAFSSVAAQLIHQGSDAVVAMSTSILVASATRYAEAFYRALARGAAVPLAHERARQQLQRDPRRHLLHRRLDEEGHRVQVNDWWLPHFYQQRPITFQLPPSGSSRKRVPASATPLQRLNAEMPPSPPYGFTGRARELLEIEWGLIQGKLVVMAGFGGTGKTALAREAADWFTRAGMYTRACFVSFEHGGDVNTLLSTLGHFLGVYDGQYNPQDHAAALAKLAPALKQHPTLVVADNLESLLPAGKAPLPLEERLALWGTLRELSMLKAGVLMTSRDPSIGDEQVVQGKDVAHLSLRGLHPEDAYLLASSVLEKLKIDRVRAPYADLRSLLKQLDYHPLAMQLVLPALRTHSLVTIRQQFAELLLQFTDDTESEHNRSLLASLQYSLNRLSNEQRALLSRLTLFEGGALEENLLAITAIPQNVWVSLRTALEQAALLTSEQVRGFTAPFLYLHFHPILVPFLRSQPSFNDLALRQRYVTCYRELAANLYQRDQRYPQLVRTLALRELPNLRRTLDLLLEQGEREAALDQADAISRFLYLFGRLRERADVQQRVGKVFEQQSVSPGEPLTREEYQHQFGLGEDEFERGDIQAAYRRFGALLKRIEEQREDAPRGPGSYQHRVTLKWLAHCQLMGGQPAAAKARVQEALEIIEELLEREPENQAALREQGIFLTDLGNILSELGSFAEAQQAYEQSLQIARQQGDLPGRVALLVQLGALALKERHYDKAQTYYTEARVLSQALGEPAVEAGILHNLGMVAEAQQDWEEAECCYRESLKLMEQLGDLAGAARTCSQLGIVAKTVGRLTEAEGWYKHALELDEQVHPGGLSYGRRLNNLADLLVNEVSDSLAPLERLAEARGYAEQALAIIQPLEASAGVWATWGILANIAELEGQAREARAYRRQERETYAAFEGNRYHISHQNERLIALVVAAARGNLLAREAVINAFPDGEAKGWHISGAVRRIWAREREWHDLADGERLNREEALLILCILETLAQPSEEEIEAIVESFSDTVALAARGYQHAWQAVQEVVPLFEAAGWHLALPWWRIAGGERDLPTLVKGLGPLETFIIGQIVEKLAQPPEKIMMKRTIPLRDLLPLLSKLPRPSGGTESR